MEAIAGEYYNIIDKLITNAKSYADTIDTDNRLQEYKERLTQIESEINGFFQFRNEILIPYIHELHGKATTGHNCSQCSGKCDVQHNMKTYEFSASLERMKRIMLDMRPGFLLADTSPFKGQLKILHNEIVLCCNALSEVMYMEENILLPKIIEAQKLINVYS